MTVDSALYFDVNFVYVGDYKTDSIKQAYGDYLNAQIDIMNERVKGSFFQFRLLDSLVNFYPYENYTISEVRNMYFNDDSELESLLSSLERKGSINVFCFNFSKESSITGYTPTLISGFEFYKAATPRYDRVIVTDFGMKNERTLVHELMHFFHASEDVINMSEERKIELGILTYQDVCDNEMNYSCCGRKLTNKQLENLINNAYSIRGYLLQ